MKSPFGSNTVGARLLPLTAALVLTSVAPASFAQETEAALLFDQEVLDLLLESRIQKPADQATAQERAAAIDELNSIYVISNLPRAQELAKTPAVRAQIEMQERALIFNAFANDFLTKNPPSEQEIFNMYEEQVALSPPEEFKARHILVETQGAAVALIEQLQSGADFVELATENSTGPSAATGGDLGWFTAQAMVQPFSVAVSALENGQFTPEPVQTQFGWHVILREDSRESAPPPLDSVRDVLAQRVSQEKFQELLNGLKAKQAD